MVLGSSSKKLIFACCTSLRRYFPPPCPAFLLTTQRYTCASPKIDFTPSRAAFSNIELPSRQNTPCTPSIPSSVNPASKYRSPARSTCIYSSKISLGSASDLYEVDHCTAFRPCSTGHMTPTSSDICISLHAIKTDEKVPSAALCNTPNFLHLKYDKLTSNMPPDVCTALPRDALVLHVSTYGG